MHLPVTVFTVLLSVLSDVSPNFNISEQMKLNKYTLVSIRCRVNVTISFEKFHRDSKSEKKVINNLNSSTVRVQSRRGK